MSEEAKNGGPAFPVHGGYSGDDPRNQILGGGMSLRDWFAGQALAGLCAHYGTPDGAEVGAIPSRAYVLADVMLSARQQKDENDGR
jgi:hypothetical protein